MRMGNSTYVLLEEANSSNLIKKVNALIVAGWHLQGGISYNARDGLYLQAMVMYFHGEGKHE